MRSCSILLALCLLSQPCALVALQEHHHAGGGAAVGPEKLGQVSFPISCAEAVRKPFERAVALLHSFQYEAARQGFREVARQDPNCAMAYWGEAMSLYHQLWDWSPSPKTLNDGWKAARKAQSLSAPTPRERAYIDAIAAYYRDPNRKEVYRVRAGAYRDAMRKVYQNYPEDGEAAAFYALSLFASDPPKDQELAARREAIAILHRLFAAQPDHPGAAHYLIHACDTPELASQGLEAARRYAQIAPSSSHALHMPSHIFTRLGLWQESIESNLAAAEAARQATLAHQGDASYQLHAMDFLHYSYLQVGRDAAARQLIDALKQVPGINAHQAAAHKALFEARYALELHHWADAAALAPPKGGPLGVQIATYHARILGEAHTGHAEAARGDLEKAQRLRAKAAATRKYQAPDIEEQEEQAWVEYAEGKPDAALKTLRAAAEREDAEGPDNLGMPAREMLGDLLLELHRPAEALAEYETALKETPKRFDGLYGAARAAELAGKSEQAKAYYAQLVSLCDHAPTDRSELQEARAYASK